MDDVDLGPLVQADRFDEGGFAVTAAVARAEAEQLYAVNHALFAVNPQSVASGIDKFLQQFGHYVSPLIGRHRRGANKKAHQKAGLALGWARIDIRRGEVGAIPVKLLWFVVSSRIRKNSDYW
jgi:hypothetical protein